MLEDILQWHIYCVILYRHLISAPREQSGMYIIIVDWTPVCPLSLFPVTCQWLPDWERLALTLLAKCCHCMFQLFQKFTPFSHLADTLLMPLWQITDTLLTPHLHHTFSNDNTAHEILVFYSVFHHWLYNSYPVYQSARRLHSVAAAFLHCYLTSRQLFSLAISIQSAAGCDLLWQTPAYICHYIAVW